MLVVGDQRTLKVHVHTDEPERATALFAGVGSVSRLDVADMHEQVQQRTDRLAEPTAACGVVAVVAGKGMEDLFTSLGATPLPGGPTLNPSTYELLAGIHDVPAEEVVVLPNSPNVLMAAERAAELSEKRVFVVPTRSQQAGLAAAVALDPDARRGGERPGDARGARARAHRRRHRAPRATTPRRARRASTAATPSASSTSASSHGASRPRRSRPCSASWAARPSWSR